MQFCFNYFAGCVPCCWSTECRDKMVFITALLRIWFTFVVPILKYSEIRASRTELAWLAISYGNWLRYLLKRYWLISRCPWYTSRLHCPTLTSNRSTTQFKRIVVQSPSGVSESKSRVLNLRARGIARPSSSPRHESEMLCLSKWRRQTFRFVATLLHLDV